MIGELTHRPNTKTTPNSKDLSCQCNYKQRTRQIINVWLSNDFGHHWIVFGFTINHDDGHCCFIICYLPKPFILQSAFASPPAYLSLALKRINKHFYSYKMDDTSRIILFKYLIKSFATSVKKFSLGSIENAQFGKRLKTAISGVFSLKARTFCVFCCTLHSSFAFIRFLSVRLKADYVNNKFSMRYNRTTTISIHPNGYYVKF